MIGPREAQKTNPATGGAVAGEKTGGTNVVPLSLVRRASNSSVGFDPQFDPQRNEIGFPVAEPIPTTADETSIDVMETVARKGIFEREFRERRFTCPNCNAYDLQFMMVCPRCGSPTTVRTAVIEHFGCGCTRPRKAFETNNGHRCPECREQLEVPGGDHACFENMHVCRDCEGQFDAREHRLLCDSCGIYRPSEVAEQVLYGYTFDDRMASWLEAMLELRQALLDIVEDRGFDVDLDSVISGDKGGEHFVHLHGKIDPLGLEIAVRLREGVAPGDVLEMETIQEETGVEAYLATGSAVGEEIATLGKQCSVGILWPQDDEDVDGWADCLDEESPTPRWAGTGPLHSVMIGT